MTVAVFVLLCLFLALLAGADLLPSAAERRAGLVVI
ncbi:MAG: hypothetical protein JWO98_4789 [Frankiales bacterium]|jgi:hypothetical protein|nr:hypothetical protein [Frankiales bacterium]